MKKLILIPCLFALQIAFAQTTAVFQYGQYPVTMMTHPNNGCGDGSVCCFGSVPTEFFGYNHTATHGCVSPNTGGASGSGLLLGARNMNNGTWRRGDGFYIEYPFLQGYTYRIKTKMVVTGPNWLDTDAGADASARSYLQVQLTNNPQQYNGSFCTVSAEPVDISNTTNPYGYFYDTDPALVTKERIITLQADQCYSYILFNCYPDDNASCAAGFTLSELTIEPVENYFTISGPNGICDGTASATYQITNPPTGAIITWSLNNTNASLPGSTVGNSIEVTKVATYGRTQLSATIQTCGKTYTAIPKEIILSAPNPNLFTKTFTTSGITKGLETCNILTEQFTSGKYHGYVSVNSSVATSYTWTLIGGTSGKAKNLFYPTYPSVEIQIFPAPAYGAWQLTVANTCGSFIRSYSFYAEMSCPIVPPDRSSQETVAAKDNITISPNPAGSQITIAIHKDNAVITAQSHDEVNKIDEIKIYDLLGRLRKQQHYNKAINVTINVSDLSNGIYFVEIIKGKNSLKRSINIKR
jgi:hypothetical protein